MYDLIGDLHGHATELKRLLRLMDYHQEHGCYRHESRKVIFVGDFIDRGPDIREVLEIVRTMIEEGTALAVMGNHEFNAIAFEAGLRPNNAKNRGQYAATLQQLRVAERLRWVDWFRTLPLWLDLGDLRVVHACWNTAAMNHLREELTRHGGFSDTFLREAGTLGTPTFKAIEVVLKGPEIELPEGLSTLDADGNPQRKSRTKWFHPVEDRTWKDYLFARASLPDTPVTGIPTGHVEPYPADAPPVFFGHYWYQADRPVLISPNVACLDYSVAKKGYLCAYRWSGERVLDATSFIGTYVDERVRSKE